jgi:hypothetical protein
MHKFTCHCIKIYSVACVPFPQPNLLVPTDKFTNKSCVKCLGYRDEWRMDVDSGTVDLYCSYNAFHQFVMPLSLWKLKNGFFPGILLWFLQETFGVPGTGCLFCTTSEEITSVWYFISPTPLVYELQREKKCLSFLSPNTQTVPSARRC